MEKNGKQEPNTHEGISKLKGEKNEKSSQILKVREALVFFSLLKFSIFPPFFNINTNINIKIPKKFNINIKINILEMQISISISKSIF